MEIRRTHLSFSSSPVDRPLTHRIVIHHTAGAARQTVHQIHNYHKSKGWIGIGYNLLQQEDGKWYEGRGLDKQGAHATGYNRNAIGICLTGNFDIDPVPTKRWESLIEMCAFLMNRYGLEYTDVVGHKELPGAATACPGGHLDLRRLREMMLQNPIPDSPIYRVLVDGEQVGAYRTPIGRVTQAVARKPKKIVIERTGQ